MFFNKKGKIVKTQRIYPEILSPEKGLPPFLGHYKTQYPGNNPFRVGCGEEHRRCCSAKQDKTSIKRILQKVQESISSFSGHHHRCLKRIGSINLSSGLPRIKTPADLRNLFTDGLKGILLLTIRGYQRVLSPLFPTSCRFYPTCSEYSFRAIQTYGLIKGFWLSLKRIARCHPFSSGGVDPLP